MMDDTANVTKPRLYVANGRYRDVSVIKVSTQLRAVAVRKHLRFTPRFCLELDARWPQDVASMSQSRFRDERNYRCQQNNALATSRERSSRGNPCSCQNITQGNNACHDRRPPQPK
jgi:hypothetical protein